MKKITYEQAVKRLEEIVEQLNSGSLSLEDSLKLYEEGAKLTELCHTVLKNARQKITDIKDVVQNEDK